MITTTYDIKEIQNLLNVSRTQVLRIADEHNWEVAKVKVGRTYKNVYKKQDVESYLVPIKEKDEKEEKEYTRTVKLKEAKHIDELPDWNQQLANAKYILCIKLEEAYEYTAGTKTQIIEKFVENVYKDFPQQMEVIKNISVSSLRRWYGIFIKNKDNPLALASGHGTNKGIRYVSPDVLETVKSLYLSKNKPKMTVVWEQVIQLYGANVISYGTLRNYIKNDLSKLEKDLGRMGRKEFKDTHMPFIQRDYSDIKAGDIWMSDGHDLEMMCYRGNKRKSNGERYFGSPKLIVWIDVKSRLITGWTLAWTETTEAIAIALKRGIEKYGLPKGLYTDNGKAYKSKVLKGTEELDGLYATLGLEVNHALPYNAQAKHIERWFVDFKESFTKLSHTYKGGNIVERPEHMKSFAMEKLVKGQILEQEELEQAIEVWIKNKNDWYYKLRRAGGLKAHRGKGMDNLTPLELFNKENPAESRRMLPEEKLRLLFLYEEIRTVQQNGIEYLGNTYTHEELYFHLGDRVKIKYDPHQLEEIYVYLETGEFLCKATKLKYAGWNDIDAIKEHKKRLKKIKKLSREILDIREEIREQENIVEHSLEDYIETEKAGRLEYNKIEKESDKDVVYLDDGIYVEID